jgi:hypothetical protein
VREVDTVALEQPEGEGVKEVYPERLSVSVPLADVLRDADREGQEEEEPDTCTLRETVAPPEGLPETLLDPQWLLERVGEVDPECEAVELSVTSMLREREALEDRVPVTLPDLLGLLDREREGRAEVDLMGLGECDADAVPEVVSVGEGVWRPFLVKVPVALPHMLAPGVADGDMDRLSVLEAQKEGEAEVQGVGGTDSVRLAESVVETLAEHVTLGEALRVPDAQKECEEEGLSEADAETRALRDKVPAPVTLLDTLGVGLREGVRAALAEVVPMSVKEGCPLGLLPCEGVVLLHTEVLALSEASEGEALALGSRLAEAVEQALDCTLRLSAAEAVLHCEVEALAEGQWEELALPVEQAVGLKVALLHCDCEGEGEKEAVAHELLDVRAEAETEGEALALRLVVWDTDAACEGEAKGEGEVQAVGLPVTEAQEEELALALAARDSLGEAEEVVVVEGEPLLRGLLEAESVLDAQEEAVGESDELSDVRAEEEEEAPGVEAWDTLALRDTERDTEALGVALGERVLLRLRLGEVDPDAQGVGVPVPLPLRVAEPERDVHPEALVELVALRLLLSVGEPVGVKVVVVEREALLHCDVVAEPQALGPRELVEEGRMDSVLEG